jgi:hypothetical protein
MYGQTLITTSHINIRKMIITGLLRLSGRDTAGRSRRRRAPLTVKPVANPLDKVTRVHCASTQEAWLPHLSSPLLSGTGGIAL